MLRCIVWIDDRSGQACIKGHTIYGVCRSNLFEVLLSIKNNFPIYDIEIADSNKVISKNIKNSSKTANLAKFKNSDQIKGKRFNFTKVNFFGANFLTPKAKKTFTKILILYCLKPKYYICIKTDTLGIKIGRIPHQLILD